MARRCAMLTVALLLGIGQAATAQDDRWETLEDDVEEGVDDIVHIWTSPFRVEADDVPALLGVASATLAAGAFDGEIQHWVRTHPDALPVRILEPFRESSPLSRFGRTWFLLPLSGAMYATGLAFEADDLREAGLGCAVSDVANTLARHGIARLLGRLRPESRRGPYVFDPLRFGEWEWRSFPAGHAANIMACTAFWTGRFDLGPAEPAMVAFAALVGLARIVDEAHWMSDTVFGASFGWAVGSEVADRFLRRRARRERAERPVATLRIRIPLPR